MTMVHLASVILEAAGDEPIEAIVVGPFEGDGWEPEPYRPHGNSNVVLSWDEARPLLDYAYDNDFGGEDCHPFFAWTRSWVLLMREYDGATSVVRVPRHPSTAKVPSFA